MKNRYTEFNKAFRCIGCNEYTFDGVRLDTKDLGKNRCICNKCAERANLKKADKNADNVLTLFFTVDPDKLPTLNTDCDVNVSSRIYAALRAKFHYRRHNGLPVAMGVKHERHGSKDVWKCTMSLAYGEGTRQDPRRPLHGLEEQGFTLTHAHGYRVGKGMMETDKGIDEMCNLWAKGFTYPTL